MSDTRRLLLVGGSLLCLLVVASTLPAADPRLEVAAGTPSEPGTNSTPVPRETPEPTAGIGSEEPDIRVSEPVQPGSEAEIRLVGVEDPSDVDIQVDGEYAGTTDADGELDIEVPLAREMTVTAVLPFRSEQVSRTVDIRTDVGIQVDGARAPGRTVDVNATVGSMALSDATVTVDGEQVATTNANGLASVRLPASAGPTEVRVERDIYEGERTVDVAAPNVTLESPLLFPGSFATATVTADGATVANASVAVNGEQAAETGADGEAPIQLPLTGTVRVSTEVGAETATTTVTGLYLRLTVVAVLVPGLIIGAVWSAGILLSAIGLETTERPRRQAPETAGETGNPFVKLAELLGAFVDGLAQFISGLGTGSWRLSLSWPSLPTLGGLSTPGISFPSMDGMSVPSVPGFSRWFGSGDDPDPDVALDSGAPVDTDTETVAGRRAQIRAVWHAFLDRLGVENRETMTAGQVARRAVAEGFPAKSVWRLVATFRAVEYGDYDPSLERVAAVRAATEDLLANDDEEDTQ